MSGIVNAKQRFRRLFIELLASGSACESPELPFARVKSNEEDDASIS